MGHVGLGLKKKKKHSKKNGQRAGMREQDGAIGWMRMSRVMSGKVRTEHSAVC